MTRAPGTYAEYTGYAGDADGADDDWTAADRVYAATCHGSVCECPDQPPPLVD